MVLSIFSYAYCTCLYVLGEMSPNVLSPLNCFVLLLSFKGSSYILGIKPLSSMICKYILPICGFFFTLFIVSFAHVLILIKSIFLLFPVLLVSYLRNHFKIQGHTILLMSSSKSSVVLALKFRSFGFHVYSFYASIDKKI